MTSLSRRQMLGVMGAALLGKRSLEPEDALASDEPFTGDVIDCPADGGPRAFTVRTTNPSGTFDRFIVENNQDTDEVDINFRNCAVNFGNRDREISTDGVAVFMQPPGGDQNMINVCKPGEGPNGTKVFLVGPNGHVSLRVGGLSDTALEVKVAADAQPRMRIDEFGKITSGAGGDSPVDVGLGRTAANELTLDAGDSLRLGDGAFFHWGHANNAQTTAGAAGGASALPATPTKYLKVKDSTGAILLIPAYAT